MKHAAILGNSYLPPGLLLNLMVPWYNAELLSGSPSGQIPLP